MRNGRAVAVSFRLSVVNLHVNFCCCYFSKLIMETPLEGRQDTPADDPAAFFTQIIVPPSVLDKLETLRETMMKKK